MLCKARKTVEKGKAMSYDEHEDCDKQIAKLEDENRKLQLIELFGTISTVLAGLGGAMMEVDRIIQGEGKYNV